jgi:light-regulated signal transduction histidine kinase (bacteriophytochrome)
VDDVYAESSLVTKYDHAERYANIGSGIVVIPIDKKQGDYVITFRPEVITTVNWGGNPEEVLNFESDGKKYHPRNSFRLWKETVLKTSLPWHSDEITVAEQLRSFIFEFFSRVRYN